MVNTGDVADKGAVAVAVVVVGVVSMRVGRVGRAEGAHVTAAGDGSECGWRGRREMDSVTAEAAVAVAVAAGGAVEGDMDV